MDERISRVIEMEARLNRIREWLEISGSSIAEDVRILEEYYQSPLWRSDFEADEAGEFPADIPHGVLSEDAVYNTLAEYEERISNSRGTGKGAMEEEAAVGRSFPDLTAG